MTPTPEQIAKLPKWAQEYIKDVSREREVSLRTLNAFQDEQTPSPFYVEENLCTGEASGPTTKRRYIQAHSVEVYFRGVHLTVDANEFGNSGSGIRLQWSSKERGGGDAAFIPTSYQSARIVSKEDMR